MVVSLECEELLLCWAFKGRLWVVCGTWEWGRTSAVLDLKVCLVNSVEGLDILLGVCLQGLFVVSQEELELLLVWPLMQSAATSKNPNSAISREASTQTSSAATSQAYVLPEGRVIPNTVFVGGIDARATATSETPNSPISIKISTQTSSAATSQDYVLPEGKVMPNTVFVCGIDVRMDETEIRGVFARFGSVKEVKIISDRYGLSKGYGFVSFYNDVDVQKIVESQITFHGKKLKLGPAIRKQNLSAHHVQPCPLNFNSPQPPFQSVGSSPNTENCMQSPAILNHPVTQYVQAYSPYQSSPVQVTTGYQLPVNNHQTYPPYQSSPVQMTSGYQLPVYNHQAYPPHQSSPVQVTTGYQLPVHNYQAYPSYQSSAVQETTGYQLPAYNHQAYPPYQSSAVQVTTGYQLPVYNHQAYPPYQSSAVQVTTGYQLPLYNHQAYPTYQSSPVQVTTGYQVPVYNYQAYPTYQSSPVQVTTGYQVPVYNYQAYPPYQSSAVQVTTGYQLPLYNHQAYPTYQSSPVQVTTGYQVPVYNYQIAPHCPSEEERRNLWTKAHSWWSPIC
uniref:deleted in azoospermia protein 3-like n=1 Tax=Jaculus jaculus TaxID=51337 RepID=UPI001E1B4FF4|nr:deleted in azoospermia protein 3-like [Jaculus jaculus]